MPPTTQDLSPRWLTPPKTDIRPEPCCRLSPPLSRVDVMEQIREQTGWEAVDQNGDVLVSTRKRSVALTQCQPTCVQPAKLTDSVGLSATTPPASSSPLLAPKKRRLAIIQKGIDAENFLLPETSRPAAKVNTLNQSPEVPPETLPDTSNSRLDPRDESLVRNLARLQNTSMSKPKTESNNDISAMQEMLSITREMNDTSSCERDILPSSQLLVEDKDNDEPVSENETDDQALLGISQSYKHCQAKARCDHADRTTMPRTNSSRSSNRPAFNPYSRAAAESWRTQSRHLKCSDDDHQCAELSLLGLEQREARLRSLTEKSGPKISHEPSDPQKSLSFQLTPLSAEDGLSPPEIEEDMRNRMQLAVPAPRWKQNPTSLELRHLQAKEHALLEPQSTACSLNVDNNKCILGKRLTINMDDRIQVAQEAERLKSQKKDLKLIQNVFHYIATLRAVGDLFTKEEDELRECKKFVYLVVDQGQSGRARRSRMQQIRDNMLARIGRIDETYLPDDHNKVEELYAEYLGSRRASDISTALERIDDEIYEVSTQRSKLQKTRYTSKKAPIKKTSQRQLAAKCSQAKKVHFDSIIEESNGCIRRGLPSGIEIDLGSHPTPRKKVKRPTKGDRVIHALSETLKGFQTRAPASGTQSTKKDTNEDGSGSNIPEDRADEISQQGSDFMHHGRSSGVNIEDQNMDEINRLENARQRDEARASAPVSQLFDPELVARMKQRTLEAGRVVMTGEVEGDEEQIELFDWNDTDSDISATSSSSLSSFDGTVQLYKYTVRGQFVGTQSYNDGDIVTFKTFWKLRNATAYLQDVIKSLHHEYIGNFDDHFELQHRHHKGLYEQVLTIGANHDVQARVWTDRELVLVDTCKLAASKARKRQLAESDEVYQVTWEKVTATTTTTTNTSPGMRTATLSSQEQHTNHDNNCIVNAGLSSDASPTITTTTTERCPDPVIHRNLASANRMAKEDFMTWYSQFFPVEEHKHSCITEQGTIFFDYSGMLKQINEAHENTLKRLGDVGCFMAEEEIALTKTEDDDVATAAGGRITKTELMKVYVKPVMVLGPKN